MESLLEALNARFSPDRVLVNESMKAHTTMRVGGPADIFVLPASAEELIYALEAAQRCGAPACVIGNGSNLIVRDGGIRGLVICLGEPFGAVAVEETLLTAQAGALLSRASAAALQGALTGLEFASGIPGTVGGAVAMNAGAYGGQIADVLLDADVLMDGAVKRLSKDDLRFGYRTSAILERGGIVLAARFALSRGDAAQIRARMADLNSRRREKQPLNHPSAGSTFKRPEGRFAGALIEAAGLKGCRVGGAQVSQKHAGFVVNAGGASAQDVLDLIAHVQNTVQARSGVWLEREVRVLGE